MKEKTLELKKIIELIKQNIRRKTKRTQNQKPCYHQRKNKRSKKNQYREWNGSEQDRKTMFSITDRADFAVLQTAHPHANTPH